MEYFCVLSSTFDDLVKKKKYLRQIASKVKMNNQTKESVITTEPSKSCQ